MAEATLTRCKCGDVLLERGNRGGIGTHLRCDHCDRECKGNRKTCPRCKQIGEWLE